MLAIIQAFWDSYKRTENTYKLLEIQRDLFGLAANPFDFDAGVPGPSDARKVSPETMENDKTFTVTEQDYMMKTQNERLRDQRGLIHNLVGPDADPTGPLARPGRQFIREGWLQKYSKKGYQQRLFFLFSDQLVYASRMATPQLQFKVKECGVIHILHLSLE
ncbi:unnamed protein product [Protopolystoma xenopodis]|uniref:PH domain-containing protein n=1 Tax=Protopolystoma xenopodis TaxID=117903 RepID=A0A3S5AZX1_9PLAT|nr:unnamed protein product [Protopolystoma xenopodis]